MNFFTEMNKKLDEGWKLTDSNCPICRSSIMYNPKDKTLFCVKCVMPCKLDLDIIDNEEETQSKAQKKPSYDESSDDEEYQLKSDNEFKWRTQGNAPPSKTDEIAKLLSQKLLQGYTMLEECCAQCMSPIMRSKNFEYTCVGCKWVKTKKEFDNIVETSNQQSQSASAPPAKVEAKKEAPKQVAQPQQQQPQQQQSSQVNQATHNVSASAPKKESVSRSEFFDSIQRMLSKTAQHYESKVDALVQLNQTSELATLVEGPLRTLISVQKQLDETQ